MMNNHPTTQIMVSSTRLTASLIILIGGSMLLSTLVGCGGSSRGPVSGTVMLDGQPLEYGVISFSPVKGNAAPGSGGVVKDGKFEISAAKGLKPGDYKVNIEVLKKTGRMIQDFPDGPQRPERIPVQVNEAGQLQATVGAGASNCFEFSLTSKSI